eukprot:4159666-Prymnesium_polylepis.1
MIGPVAARVDACGRGSRGRSPAAQPSSQPPHNLSAETCGREGVRLRLRPHIRDRALRECVDP